MEEVKATVAMAKAYSKSRFLGIDYDGRSITAARKLAESADLTNVEFVQGPADQIPRDRKYDLICSFDCIHDMVGPVGTLRAIYSVLAPDGVYLWSELNLRSAKSKRWNASTRTSPGRRSPTTINRSECGTVKGQNTGGAPAWICQISGTNACGTLKTRWK